jgi:uncharacterized membrane protein
MDDDERSNVMDERSIVMSASRRSSILSRPSWSGSAVGLVFWLQSLTPTLIPRSWLTQALVSGVCLAVGYGIGTSAGHAIDAILSRTLRRPSPRQRRGAWIVLGVCWLVALCWGSVLWLGWQQDQLELMGMPGVHMADAVQMAVSGAAAATLLVLVGRLIARGIAALHRQVRRRVPTRPAAATTTFGLSALAAVLIIGLALAGVNAWANSFYAAQNDQTEAGITQPSSATVSGSPASLVPWESLGRTGRDFVAKATTPQQLADFHGARARLTAPVRVYAGVLSADTLQERADLAVRELERAGGFDRAVLVVWVPTGTGWMIPEAAEALEQLYAGDTAIVGMQYSYLPSLLSVFLDAGRAVRAGSILLNTIAEHWSRLPAASRPKLLLFGKSLGTAGVEAPFAAIDASSSLGNLAARTDGALIVGTKHSNPITSQIIDERDSDSPVWQPVFDGERTARFLNRDPAQAQQASTSPGPRVVYLQHPSDPVPFWGINALWRPPEWMDKPRGYDVPAAARWFPIVTATQAVADQIHQLSPPPGFGHDYATDYVDGWAAVLPPDGWTTADTERLEELLDRGGAGESEE